MNCIKPHFEYCILGLIIESNTCALLPMSPTSQKKCTTRSDSISPNITSIERSQNTKFLGPTICGCQFSCFTCFIPQEIETWSWLRWVDGSMGWLRHLQFIRFWCHVAINRVSGALSLWGRRRLCEVPDMRRGSPREHGIWDRGTNKNVDWLLRGFHSCRNTADVCV